MPGERRACWVAPDPDDDRLHRPGQRPADGRHRRHRPDRAPRRPRPRRRQRAAAGGGPPRRRRGLPVARRRGDRRHPGGRVLRAARLPLGVRRDAQRARPVHGRLAAAGRDGAGHRLGLPGRVLPGRPAARTCSRRTRRPRSRSRDDADGDLDLRPSSYDAGAAAGEPRHAERARAQAVHRAGHPRVHRRRSPGSPRWWCRGSARAAPTSTTRSSCRSTAATGIGRAIKARMLFELRAAEPNLLEVQTWHALEKEPMLQGQRRAGLPARPRVARVRGRRRPTC